MVVLVSISLVLIHLLFVPFLKSTVRKANKNLGMITKNNFNLANPLKGSLNSPGVKSLIKPVEEYWVCFHLFLAWAGHQQHIFPPQIRALPRPAAGPH